MQVVVNTVWIIVLKVIPDVLMVENDLYIRVSVVVRDID
jgi:hypothetical protein